MTAARLAALCCLALCLAGCASARSAGSGQATVWVTRDRGAHVLVSTRVRAGLTAMQALASVAKIRTRYGGRFVQAIDGVEGSASGQRDWFYFLNGYESDRSAADYRLRPGDVEWWDYRSWKGSAETVPVVVGAFPEPFLHGFDGRTRPAAVQYAASALAGRARALARALHGRALGPGAQPPRGANVLRLVAGSRPRFYAATRPGRPGDAVVFVLAGPREPASYRYRYGVP